MIILIETKTMWGDIKHIIYKLALKKIQLVNLNIRICDGSCIHLS